MPNSALERTVKGSSERAAGARTIIAPAARWFGLARPAQRGRYMATDSASLGHRVIPVDRSRAPDDDSLEKHKPLALKCSHCSSPIVLDLRSFNSHFQTPEAVLGSESAAAVREHFELRSDRSLTDGWPKLRRESCSACGAQFLICVMEHEPHNGWHQWTLRGVTKLDGVAI
jgi:hypothetical protein